VNTDDFLSHVLNSEPVTSAIRAPQALNEATEYGSAFSRGLRIELGGLVILLISGTSSLDEHGNSLHAGDFRAQCRRCFSNIAELLKEGGATWNNVVRTTCYLRDIDRDYKAFNEERNRFYKEHGLDPLPASTAIGACLCRPELLIEIETIALFRKAATSG